MNFLPFMELGGSSQSSQDPTAGTFLEPDDAVHILAPNLFKINFHDILPTTSISPRWSLLFGFRPKLPMYLSSLPFVLYTHPSHRPWFCHPNSIWLVAQIMFKVMLSHKISWP